MGKREESEVGKEKVKKKEKGNLDLSIYTVIVISLTFALKLATKTTTPSTLPTTAVPNNQAVGQVFVPSGQTLKTPLPFR